MDRLFQNPVYETEGGGKCLPAVKERMNHGGVQHIP